MSLNGLDDPKVKEAHEAAVAEPGGWFLLKYASRDEVELLGRGSGGVPEVKNQVSEYDETSPLYGFLRYRRRNVLIKYLPEDCSRLIQARVAVHFNAVCERFSPFDTTFEITQAAELKDTKLSAACSLHAASGSNSSATSSLRRRRLVEIAEEEEEDQQQRATKRQSTSPEDLEENPAASLNSTAEPSSPEEPVKLNSELAASPDETKFAAPSTSELPDFVGAETPGSPDDTGDGARRMSTQSSRPDLLGYSSYGYGKPKVKLAPRPSLDVTGRPRTAGAFRPVSQIPAGFKLLGKGSKKGKGQDDGPASPDDETAPGIPISTTTLIIPEETQRSSTELARPATSSGVSTKEMILPPPSPSRPTMSPEKARLMKAMKLREKKKKKMSEQPSNQPTDESTDSPDPEVPVQDSEVAEDDETVNEPEAPSEENTTVSNVDSAIALDASSASLNTDQGSELEQTDSHPDSPVMASSEADQSTKASSVSESTDETIHPKGEDVSDENATIEAQDDAASHDTSEDVQKDAEVEPKAINDQPEAEAPTVVSEIERSTDKPDVSGESPQQELDGLKVAEESTTAETNCPPTEKAKEAAAEANPVSETDISEPSAARPEASQNNEDSETEKIPDAQESAQGYKGTGEPAQDQQPTATDSSATAEAPPATSESTPADKPTIITEAEGANDETAQDSEDLEKEHDNRDSTQSNETAKPPKRKNFPEPIRTDLSPHNDSRPPSQAGFSDDDDLMDELQSATVMEAKPMVVGKSPVTPVFPSPTKGSERSAHTVRTASNPVRGNLLVPGDVSQSSARSVSTGAAYLHKVAQQQTGPNLSNKANMGSSISQRIKALEKLSAAGTTETVSRPDSRERPSSTFFSVRQGREPSRSPSVADRANSFTRPTARTPPSRSGSRDESPEASRRRRRDRSASVASRLSMFETPVEGQQSPVSSSRGRPESISVTAKIIRDPHQVQKSFEPSKDPSEYSHLELKQSPLLVDHQKAWTPMTMEPPRESMAEDQRSSRDSRDETGSNPRRSSLTVVRDFIKERRKSLTSNTSEHLPNANTNTTSRSPTRPPSTHQSGSLSRRLSISSRRSSFNRDREPVLTPSATMESSTSSDDTKSNSGKKSSRTGRFMRRLSTLSGSRSKISAPGISPTLTEEAEPVRPATTGGSGGSPSVVAYMGDVNVQFPDTLLWKRRNLRLDTKGFLILSALPEQSGRSAQGTKRYHMSDFRLPYVPDVEVQELPNSVVLDLIDGGGIQIACEDRSGQRNVLNTLQDAHASHASV